MRVPDPGFRSKQDGLVIVCLMSGAIMALEGFETQDVCMAVGRHSNRYGVPGFIYVDNGTQLKALQYARFSVRDLETQVSDSLGIKIIVSNAKAHSERGRVERRIRVLRETLEKLGVQTSVPMTCLQWDALFSRISNTIDNLPIAGGVDTSNETTLGYEIITPNRLKLWRNNYRSFEGCGINLEMSPNFTKLLDRNRSVYRSWFQTFVQNIHSLNFCPSKWLRSSRLPITSDLVLFVFNDGNLSKDSVSWKLGRVSKVENMKVSILTSWKTKGSEQIFIRSVVYLVGEMLINTVLKLIRRSNSPRKYTMPFFYIFSIWFGFYFKHNVCLIGISDETTRHKFNCTVCLTISYFSMLRTGDFWTIVEQRLLSQRAKEFSSGLSMLIPQEGEEEGQQV